MQLVKYDNAAFALSGLLTVATTVDAGWCRSSGWWGKRKEGSVVHSTCHKDCRHEQAVRPWGLPCQPHCWCLQLVLLTCWLASPIILLLVHPKTIVFGRTYVLLWFLSFFSRRVISELHRPIATKFCTMLLSMFSFIIPGRNFGGASPKNF